MSRQSSAAKAGRASGEVRAVDATERHADWMDQAKQISRRNKHKSPNAIAKQIANLAAENAGLTGEKPPAWDTVARIIRPHLRAPVKDN